MNFEEKYSREMNDEQIIEEIKKNCGEIYLSNDYEGYVVQYEGDIIEALKNIDYACAILVGLNYAVVSVRSGQKERLAIEVPNIVNYESSVLYTLTQISPLYASTINQFHTNPYLNLRGTGVTVGIIDTGIDYLNKEFMREDDTTRILSIWDQTIQNKNPPEGLFYGTEYTSNQINEAIIAEKEGRDPYEIVASRDIEGHGTAMAGIIGARGRGDMEGAAPDCEFVVVKLKQAKDKTLAVNGITTRRIPVFETTDLILALKYLYDTRKKLRKPMIIYIPLGSNFGGHDGTSTVERYIDIFSREIGILFVTGTGNQGDSETHYRSTLQKNGDMRTVEISVDPSQESLAISLWARKPDKFSIGFVSPSGEVIERIPARIKAKENVKFVFEGSTATVHYFYPEDFSGDEYIFILINNIRPGIWQIRVYADYIVFGDFDMWIYQRNLLGTDTRFLNPDPYITLTIPSTSNEVLTTSYYNQNNDSIVATSGRGYTRDGRIKPEVTTGGVNVTTTKVGGGTVTISGSSAAGAVLTGAMALFYQWAIVEGNDPTIYASKVKAYLIRGTRKRVGDIYPNPEWGFGILDLAGIFNALRDSSINPVRSSSEIEILEDIVNFSDRVFVDFTNDIIKHKNKT